MTKKLFINALLVAVVVFGYLPAAQATAVLQLTSGSTVTVWDNGVGDLDPTPGAIAFVGPLGNFLINIAGGVSAPNLINQIDLTSSNTTKSTTGGTMTIAFSDTGFFFPGANFAIGGTLCNGCSLTAQAFWSGSNVALAQTTQIGSTLNFSAPGAFSGSTLGTISALSPFSVTEVITITEPKRSNSSFDASLSGVPEPTSLVLLGSALIALAVLARKRASC